jgi:hypothetical protein
MSSKALFRALFRDAGAIPSRSLREWTRAQIRENSKRLSGVPPPAGSSFVCPLVVLHQALSGHSRASKLLAHVCAYSRSTSQMVMVKRRVDLFAKADAIFRADVEHACFAIGLPTDLTVVQPSTPLTRTNPKSS